jgi:probable HAF family extracellular repeat protein
MFTALDVPCGNNTAPYGVNDTGQIVGSFASNGVHGFRYSGGVFTQIDVPGGTYTEAFGIHRSAAA